MARSFDKRRHESGPSYGPGDHRSLRGAKRGPYGRLEPGDDVEVVREIERIWWALRNARLVRGGGGCCPGDNGPGPVVTRRGFESLLEEFGGVSLWYRLNETPHDEGADGAYTEAGVVPNQGPAWPGVTDDLSQNGLSASTLDAEQPTLDPGDPPPYGPDERDGWAFLHDWTGNTTIDSGAHYLAASDLLTSLGGAVRCDWPLADATQESDAAPYSAGVEDEWTTFGWIKFDGTGTGDYDAHCWGSWQQGFGSAVNRNWSVRVNKTTGKVTFKVITATSLTLDGPQLNPDEWYFVSVTWDGATMSLYVNGVLVDSAAFADFSYSSGTFTTFKVAWSTDTFGVDAEDVPFLGSLAEIAVIQKCYTPDQIAALFGAFGNSESGTASGGMSGIYIDDHSIAPTKLLPGTERQVLMTQDGDAEWVQARGYHVLRSTVAKTGTYTATVDDDVILCSASLGAFTVNLPAAADSAGRQYTIKKTDNSANAVTIDGTGSEKIDGQNTQALGSQYESVTIVCDGAAWHVVSWFAGTPL